MKLGYMAACDGPSMARRSSRAGFACAVGFGEVITQDARGHLRVSAPLPRRGEDRPGGGLSVETYPDAAPVLAFGADTSHLRNRAHTGCQPLSRACLDAEQVAAHWPAYVQGCTHGSRRACPAHWRVARTVLISEDRNRALRAVRDEASPCWQYHARRLGPAATQSAIAALIARVVIAGTPAEVARQLAAFRAATGPFGTLVVLDHDWADEAMARRSLAFLAALGQPGKAPLPPVETQQELA